MNPSLIANEHPDYIKCMAYVSAVEASGQTIEAWSKDMDITPMTVSRWRKRWEEDGLLPLVRQEYVGGVFAGVIRANQQFLIEWPALVAEWINIAKTAESDFTREKALVDIFDRVIAPAMDSRERAGEAEKSYLIDIQKSPAMLSPLSIASKPKTSEPIEEGVISPDDPSHPDAVDDQSL